MLVKVSTYFRKCCDRDIFVIFFLGIQEKAQLLKMNVPATFMSVALDEGPGPAIKYQFAELSKLNQVVSCLVRCCDVSFKCQSSAGGPVLPNPYRDLSCHDYIMQLPPQASEILFGRTRYVNAPAI